MADLPEPPEIPEAPEDLEESEDVEGTEPFEDTNAAVMAEIISDPTTSEFVKLQILNTLLQVEQDATFFQTMMKQGMDLCECPNCGHENHWLSPEDELNQMGWVTADKDPCVKKHTTEADCQRYAEACGKKKVSG